MKMWECSICKYIHNGDEAPANCPKCNAPKEKFIELSADQSALLEKSERTNSLELELLVLAQAIAKLSEEGIEINLDPGCLALFKKAQKEAIELSGIIKAELKGHMGKGKF